MWAKQLQKGSGLVCLQHERKSSSTVIACVAVLLPCSLSLQGLHVPCGARALLGLFYPRDDHCPFLDAVPRKHCKVFWALEYCDINDSTAEADGRCDMFSVAHHMVLLAIVVC